MRDNDVPIFHLLSQTANWYLKPDFLYIVFFVKAPYWLSYRQVPFQRLLFGSALYKNSNFSTIIVPQPFLPSQTKITGSAIFHHAACLCLSKPPQKSFAFPQCLAFTKLDTRNKREFTSKFTTSTQCSIRNSLRFLLMYGFRRISLLQKGHGCKQAYTVSFSRIAALLNAPAYFQ